MTKWSRNKYWFLVGIGALLFAGPLSAQQNVREWELDPLAVEAVLLPDPVSVVVTDKGQRSNDKGQGSNDKGQRSNDNYQRSNDNCQMSNDNSLDKKELDSIMTARIAYGNIDPIRPLNPKDLVLHRIDSTGVLRTEGDIFWIETMASDLYFSSANDTLQTLWSKEYPTQSLSNLLLGQIATPDFGIDLTHRRYGLDKPRFHVSWASLYNTLCTEGVRRYATGLIRDNGKSLRGILIVHHPDGNYVDMLIITTTIDELFAPDAQRKDLRGDLFTNVPQNNILNLYE